MSQLEEEIWHRLGQVMDPELHRPLTELGMVEAVRVRRQEVTVTVKLTIAGCPLKARIEGDVKAALAGLEGVSAVVVRVTVMSAEERQKLTPELRPLRHSSVTREGSRVRVLIVGSGKGGVGKSTVAVNLAVALSQLGRTVGLLDADIYGFSVPRMIGVDRRPVVLSDEMILPVEAHGIQVISMGMLVDEATPVMWRGPMLTKLLEQFMGDVMWGDLDYLVVDSPPGTGDVAITLAQRLHQAQVVLVTTPQAAAAKVAVRVGEMAKKVGQRLLGVVENMSFLRCESCGAESRLFSGDGGKELAEALGVPLLGRIPIGAEISAGGDSGQPVTWTRPDSEAAQVFAQVARAVEAAAWEVAAAAP